MGPCNDPTQPFAKTICSICYDNLKPIVEDLQAISICGHVFHELCIQQWFESCPKEKKKCPICKQTCTNADVSRLYFQSVDPNLSSKLQTQKEDLVEFKLEVRRLEGKVSELNSTLESQGNEFFNIIDEFSVCKEQLKKETLLKDEAIEQLKKEELLKNEAIEQTRAIYSLLNLKTLSLGDLNDSNISQKLQSHKEDVDELKLELRSLDEKISMLNSALESRENDLINVTNELSVCKKQLKKEVSMKNEAMEQTHTINNLLNLKTQELNKSDLERMKLQEKNIALAKELTALKLVSDLDLKHDEVVELLSLSTEPHNNDRVDILAKCLVARNKLYKELNGKYKTLEREEARSRRKLEKAKKKLEELEKLKEKKQEMETGKEMEDKNEVLRALKAPRKTKDSPSVLNGVDLTLDDTCSPQDTIKEPDVHCRKTKRSRVTENVIESTNKDGASSYILIDDDTPKVSTSPESTSCDSVPQPTKRATKDDDVACNITNEASLPVPRYQEAAGCFSAALLGPDGTKRHLGKWCKKRQNKGDFIAFGGR